MGGKGTKTKKALLAWTSVILVLLLILIWGIVVDRRSRPSLGAVGKFSRHPVGFLRPALAESFWYGEEDKDVQTFHNGYVISSQLGFFTNDRGRFPATYAELTSSPYLCIRQEDLINPYSQSPIVDDPSGSLGNISYSLMSPDRLRIRLPFIFLLNGQESAYETDNPLDTEGQTIGLISDGSSDETRIWTRSCFFLAWDFLRLFMMDSDAYPGTFDEVLRAFPVLQKMWNRYANRYVNFQTHPNPVAGDLYYAFCLVDGKSLFDLVVWLPEGGESSIRYCSDYPY
jgi:hypothetical protein